MSDVISYEPETETLRIGAREFDVLHLRSKARSEVLSSINIAMRELHGQTIVGAREVYRDTTIAIVPRMAVRLPIETVRHLPRGVIMVPETALSLTLPWWVFASWAVLGSCAAVFATYWLLSHH